MNLLEEKKEGKVITLYPVAGGNGVSYTAVNLAYALRERDPYTRIALVDFDFNNPYLGVSLTTDNVHGIDNLVDKINGNFLDEDMFKENMITLRDNIDLLKGTQLGQFNLVKQEHLTTIVEFLREAYDFIFITTNHSAADAGTSVALYVADHILVVGRYNTTNALLAQKAVDAIRNYGGRGDVGVLYNMYYNQNGIDFSEVFEGWTVYGTIPYLQDTVDNQHLSGKTLGSLKKRKNPTQEVYDSILDAFVQDF